MESNSECNDLRRRLRRRSSLFTSQGNIPSSIPTRDVQYVYPPEYQEHLTSELELWIQERQKFDTMISEKKEKLSTKPLRDKECLSDAQQNFLSSLSDYGQYIKCVHDFSNRFDIAAEKLSVKNKQFLDQQEHIKDINREVLNRCKTQF